MNLACRTWHWRAAAAFVGLAISASATAATTSTVVDLHAAPGVTQRILYVRPDAPIATIVALPGGSGVLGIAADGSVAVPCFPLYRTRQALADLGIAVALVDAASDRSVYGVTNVTAVVRWAQQQAEVPVWISGGSSSTNPAAAIANELPAGDRIGAVFFSPDVPLKPIVKQVLRPALVIYNATDPAQAAAAFYAALTAAPVKKLDALSGHSDTGCGTHLFEELDVEFATRIGAFIAANNGATGAPASVNPNQSGLSGSWANLATLGQGLQLDVVPNLHGAGRAHLFAGWFTYDVEADGGVRWYTIQGPLEPAGRSMLPIYQTLGGRFDSAQATQTRAVGTATIGFDDCSHAVLDYAFDDGRVGSIPLTRLLANVTCAPAGPPAGEEDAANFAWSGTWGSLDTLGQGLVFEFNPLQGVMFAAWYGFDADARADDGASAQDWYTLQAPAARGANTLRDIGIYSTRGGMFDRDTVPVTRQVGSADLTLHSCTSATLDYRFTEGSNAGRNGTIALTRMTPAAAGCRLWR